MVLLLIVMADSQTRTGVSGTDGPGVVAQEAGGVVGTLMVKTDFAVVAGASDLTMIVGQMMTLVAGEDRTVRHPLVAAGHLTAVVARHPLVAAHHLLGLGTAAGASVVLASTVAKAGTEHQTAQTSRW